MSLTVAEQHMLGAQALQLLTELGQAMEECQEGFASGDTVKHERGKANAWKARAKIETFASELVSK